MRGAESPVDQHEPLVTSAISAPAPRGALQEVRQQLGVGEVVAKRNRRSPGAQLSLTGDLEAMRSRMAELEADNAYLRAMLKISKQEGKRPGAAPTVMFDAAPGRSRRRRPQGRRSPSTRACSGLALTCTRSGGTATAPDVGGWMPAVRGGFRKGVRPADRHYLPLTEEVLTRHLSGDMEIGLYPLLDNDRCHWLAADFDGADGDARRPGVPEGRSCPRRDRGAGGVPFGSGRARVGLLHLSGPRGPGPAARHRPAARSHDHGRAAEPGELRPALSLAGPAPGGRDRQPDRRAAAGSPPPDGHDGVPGSGDPRTPRRPVELPVVAPARHPRES